MIPTDWPPRFQPHDRVIDLLVGPQLYTTGDTAVRELLQNAEDACALFAIRKPGYLARVTVSYSVSENWCEFSDNGLGMNKAAIQGSYAWIGAPKTEVAHIRELLASAPPEQRQIAQFGIGVLSCFGVATAVELRTVMDHEVPVALTVTDYHRPFEELPVQAGERGTAIRLVLKPDGPLKAADVPAAVRKYARHAPHVWLRNIDTGVEEVVDETWIDIPHSLPQAEIAGDPAIISGRLALDSAWFNINVGFTVELVTCNAGFLVNTNDLDLLPRHATGVRGEVNVAPGALSILMNREGFARDDLWKDFADRLAERISSLVEQLVDRYEEMLGELDTPTDAMERGILLLARGGVRSLLKGTVASRVDSLLPKVVTVGERGTSRRFRLADLFEKARLDGGESVYFVREDEGTQQRRTSFADNESGSAIQVMETVNTTPLRAIQLQAKGRLVVSCRPRSIPHRTASGEQMLQVHDVDLLNSIAGQYGVTVQSVNDASAAEVALSPLPESAIINDVLEAGEALRIVYLPSSDSRVIPDYTGRLLNAAHPDIRALLKVLPSAIGNPVLKTLIQAYVDLGNWDYQQARLRLKGLLEDPKLAEKAQLKTSAFLRDYLDRKLAGLRRNEENE